MTCFHPLTAFQCFYSSRFDKSCKSSILFNELEARRGKFTIVDEIKLPCGRCLGCRLARSRVWAIRCLHEASLHEDNSFVTLTYDNDHLPVNGSLDLRHFQLFMKRLRFKFGDGIRFFHCGEYGAQLSRPHYHVLLFGLDFPDKKFWKTTISKSKSGANRLYTSSILESLWGKGFAPIGDVTFESAAYVARYITKKFTSRKVSDVDAHYKGKKPEYVTMSRRPGIASRWFDKFSSDVYPNDYCVVDGRKLRPPRFYDTLLERLDPVMYDNVKLARGDAIEELLYTNPEVFSPATLKAKEMNLRARCSMFLSRPLEE